MNRNLKIFYKSYSKNFKEFKNDLKKCKYISKIIRTKLQSLNKKVKTNLGILDNKLKSLFN